MQEIKTKKGEIWDETLHSPTPKRPNSGDLVQTPNQIDHSAGASVCVQVLAWLTLGPWHHQTSIFTRAQRTPESNPRATSWSILTIRTGQADRSSYKLSTQTSSRSNPRWWCKDCWFMQQPHLSEGLTALSSPSSHIQSHYRWVSLCLLQHVQKMRSHRFPGLGLVPSVFVSIKSWLPSAKGRQRFWQLAPRFGEAPEVIYIMRLFIKHLWFMWMDVFIGLLVLLVEAVLFFFYVPLMLKVRSSTSNHRLNFAYWYYNYYHSTRCNLGVVKGWLCVFFLEHAIWYNLLGDERVWC